MAFIKQIPQDSAEFHRQLGQYAVGRRPDGVKLPWDVIRFARLPENLCPLKRYAALLVGRRLDEIAPEFRVLLTDGPPHLRAQCGRAVVQLVYEELKKARHRQGVYETIF